MGELLIGLGGYQLFDSMALDADGNICVATLPVGITVISPAGQVIETLRVSDPFTTNICLGGPQNDTGYITMSSAGQLLAVEGFREGLKLNF
jgi:gluconolactonase